MLTHLEPWEILEKIWSLSEGKNVFLPEQREGTWFEGPALNPVHALEEWCSTTGPTETYFTPLRYDGSNRRREFVGKPGVLFADLDDGARLNGFTPHLLIASSINHQHAYWFLNQPVDDLAEWENKARGLTYAIGADPGGWDATQVLRVPGTLNYKYAPPTRVRVLFYRPNMRAARLEDFPDAPAPRRRGGSPYQSPSTEEMAERADVLRRIWPQLDLEEQSLLSMGVNHPVRDRSKVIHKLGARLLELGCSPLEAFIIINPMPWNKFRDRPEVLMNGLYKIALQP